MENKLHDEEKTTSRYLVDKEFGFDRFEHAVLKARELARKYDEKQYNENGIKIYDSSIILDTKKKIKHIIKFRPTKGYRVFVL